MKEYVLYALVGAVLWGLADIVTKKLLSSGVSNTAIVFANSLIALVVVVPFFFREISQLKEIPLLILNGLFIVGGLILFYIAISKGHVAVASAVMSTKVLWTLVFSILILRDSPSPVSVAGVVLIVSGLILLNLGGER